VHIIATAGITCHWLTMRTLLSRQRPQRFRGFAPRQQSAMAPLTTRRDARVGGRRTLATWHATQGRCATCAQANDTPSQGHWETS